MLKHIVRAISRAVLAAGILGICGPGWAGEVKSPTMDAIRKRDQLICGIDTGIPGFAFQDSSGKWQGLDVAYCRAIAAAVIASRVPPMQ